MADNKQYITQVQENGTVMISEDVIAAIIAQAIKDVEGVVSLNTKPGSELVDMIGMNWGKGLKITIADDNSVTIDCELVIGYNQSVVVVAKAAQEAIRSAVESMTGVTVTAININVCGISRQ